MYGQCSICNGVLNPSAILCNPCQHRICLQCTLNVMRSLRSNNLNTGDDLNNFKQCPLPQCGIAFNAPPVTLHGQPLMLSLLQIALTATNDRPEGARSPPNHTNNSINTNTNNNSDAMETTNDTNKSTNADVNQLSTIALLMANAAATNSSMSGDAHTSHEGRSQSLSSMNLINNGNNNNNNNNNNTAPGRSSLKATNSSMNYHQNTNNSMNGHDDGDSVADGEEGDSGSDDDGEESSDGKKSPNKKSASSRKKGKRGVSCHQCKSNKDKHLLLFCTHKFVDGKRLRQCRKKYCQSCLKRWYYTLDWVSRLRDTAVSGHWCCPSCSGACTCAACRKRGPDGAKPGPGPDMINDRSMMPNNNNNSMMSRRMDEIDMSASPAPFAQQSMHRTMRDDAARQMAAMSQQQSIQSRPMINNMQPMTSEGMQPFSQQYQSFGEGSNGSGFMDSTQYFNNNNNRMNFQLNNNQRQIGSSMQPMMQPSMQQSMQQSSMNVGPRSAGSNGYDPQTLATLQQMMIMKREPRNDFGTQSTHSMAGMGGNFQQTSGMNWMNKPSNEGMSMQNTMSNMQNFSPSMLGNDVNKTTVSIGSMSSNGTLGGMSMGATNQNRSMHFAGGEGMNQNVGTLNQYMMNMGGPSNTNSMMGNTNTNIPMNQAWDSRLQSGHDMNFRQFSVS